MVWAKLLVTTQLCLSLIRLTNKPIILKDHYSISGSDTSRIGWVEVGAEDGTSGYLWYLKAEAETRAKVC